VLVDVDSKVVASEDLIRRVRDVLAKTDKGELTFARTVSPSADDSSTLAIIGERANAMRQRLAEIQQPAILNGPGPVGRVKRMGKKVVRKATWWYVEPRWVPQGEFDTETAQLATDVGSAVRALWDGIIETRGYARRVADRTRLLVQDTGDVTTAVAEMTDTLRDLNTIVESVERRLDALTAREKDVDRVRGEIKEVLDRLGAASASGADLDYVAFEDRFRGESGDLKEAQRDYLQYLPPASEPGLVVDVGCGRGEMVELLTEVGHMALGVESDPDMVASCRERGVAVEEGNGVTWMAARDDETLKAIFCAQVVEHLLTSELTAFIGQSLRALRPGGALIMETINPRSWFALGNHFLADTSHVRPVHPETLRFICEQAGFSRAELVLRSRHQLADAADHIPRGPVRDALEALLETVYGYQDYAIIAVK
jgi:SAM-dependent methyltransferase